MIVGYQAAEPYCLWSENVVAECRHDVHAAVYLNILKWKWPTGYSCSGDRSRIFSTSFSSYGTDWRMSKTH